jgi:esterase/lipase
MSAPNNSEAASGTGLNGASGAVAKLSDGVRLPYCVILDSQHSMDIGLIFAHGLGAKDPHKKSHLNDEWSIFMESLIPKSIPIPTMFYTARGHGDSDGWMQDVALQGKTFQWNHLSHDMHEMAVKHGNFDSFIATGSSMGSATALFCAIHFPKKVKGVIMIRPPTAWEDRKSRRSHLIKSSQNLEKTEINAESQYHWVLKHAAYSDLPHIETERDLYRNISCPVLLLTIAGDDSHPVETAKTLHGLIASSEVHIAASKAQAKKLWPKLVSDFIGKIVLGSSQEDGAL